MKRLLPFLMPFVFSTSVFAEDATVELTLSGLSFQKTDHKIKPDEGDSSKQTDSEFMTTPWNVEIEIAKDKYTLTFRPEVTDDLEGDEPSGLLGFGYKFIPELETGLRLGIESKSTKADNSEIKNKSSLYALYAKYWVPFSDTLTLEIQPTFGAYTEETKLTNDDSDFESTDKSSGPIFGLALTLSHQWAKNLFYEPSLAYSISNLKVTSEVSSPAEDREDNQKQAATKLSVTPLAVKVRI